MSLRPSTKADGQSAFSTQQQRRSRLLLLGLFAVFGVPLLLATLWLHWVRAGNTQLGSTSHGELISPAVPIAPFELSERARAAQGQRTKPSAAVFDESGFRGLWTLLYFPTGECAESCRQNLYHMRQVRLALNHRMSRVQRVVVLEHDAQVPQAVLGDHPGLRVLHGSAQNRAALTAQVLAAEAALPARKDALYLIDPLGNLMLRFPSELPPRSMLEDLRHLLKVSRIG